MSGELVHKTATDLVQSRTDYEALDEHQCSGQTTGDLLYFDGNYWVRKARGFLNKVDYVVAAANSDATAKLTADLVCTGTSSNPIDATNINTALSGYQSVLLLNGDYYINAALTPQTKSVLRGQGMYRTIINNKGSTYGIDFEGTATNDRKEALSLADFSILGNANALAALYAKFNYGPSVVQRCRFQGSGYGAQMDNNAADWTFYDCRFDSNTVGTRLQVSSNPISFFHCIWSSSVNEGMIIDGNTNEILIVGGNFNDSGLQAISISSAMRNLTCLGTHFEYNATDVADTTSRTHVLINHASAVNIWFQNCWFNGENASQVAFTNHGITLVDSSNVTALNCGFRKLVTSCYDIAASKTLYHWLTYIESATVPANSSGAGTLAVIQTA